MALGYAVAKFRKSNEENTDITHSVRLERLEHFVGILFDKVNADIRIQHPAIARRPMATTP
jgi:hypothetical protein